MEAAGEEIPRDPFGHVMLDKVNPGAWFASKFAEKLNAEKVMIQKSGYYSRAAAANDGQQQTRAFRAGTGPVGAGKFCAELVLPVGHQLEHRRSRLAPP